jgi:signal transduction histidine kinase
VDSPLLFEYPKVRDSRTADPGVNISLLGDFAPGEDYWDVIAESAQWLLEIDAKSDNVHYNVIPTRDLKKERPETEPSRLKIKHPTPDDGPFFQARILVREGQLHGSAGLKGWASSASGVKVFMEGFRVLPYGEARNDWLSLDLDYTGRSRKFSWLEDEAEGPEDRDAALVGLPNRSYFGAVFLTQSGAPALRMLINREGFIPDSSFDTLVGLVRTGIDLTTRSRAAAKFDARKQRKEQRAVTSQPSTPTGRPPKFGSAVETARTFASQARQLLADGRVNDANEKISGVLAAVEAASEESQEMMNEAGLIRVLASVGTQMAAFIHEINALLRMAESVEGAVERLRAEADVPAKTRRNLGAILRTIGDLRRRLERQASYLVDVVTPDARRRRSKQSLAERLEAGGRLVQHLIDDRKIKLINDIPPELKSPPMFPAELATIFSNLLTNAVKAAGAGGTIRAVGRLKDQQAISVVVENSGTAVNLRDAERWFKPFESTTTSVDPVLGQGMGLGLPITRKMLEQYGADIRFIKPDHGFATALEIVFPNS